MAAIQQRKWWTTVEDFLAALPASLGFYQEKVGPECIELKSSMCIIRFSFDRHAEHAYVVELIDPRTPNRGLHLFLLQYLRRLRPLQDATPGAWAKFIADHFMDVLCGDFSIQSAYDAVEDRFFAYLYYLNVLPKEHPGQVLFNNFDLRWIAEVEKYVNIEQAERGREDDPGDPSDNDS